MATTSGNTTATPKAPTTPSSFALARRRRQWRACLLTTLVTALALSLTLLVLWLTVLRVRAPTLRLVSVQLTGVAPRFVVLPVPSLHLNVTVLLTVAVRNPNTASFTYASGGHADLSYRGAHVGDAEIGPGLVPSRGDTTMELAVTLQADRFVAGTGDVARLAEDMESGEMPLDATTRVPGTVDILGVFKHHAVAYSDCQLALDVAGMRVRSYECRDRTEI